VAVLALKETVRRSLPLLTSEPGGGFHVLRARPVADVFEVGAARQGHELVAPRTNAGGAPSADHVEGNHTGRTAEGPGADDQ
jgi:hypothetical protein